MSEQTTKLLSSGYNPDVLECLANLSNDEVFTPPKIANAMLDMLPQEIFSNPDITFLDPACKSGVFLREIAKRLIKGLEPKIPDLQERIDHIFHKQLYGIAITELTALLTRRSLYCSKYADSNFSVSKFDTPEGNIRFKRIEHKWLNGRCVFCGASQDQYNRGADLETHAYEWIHTNNPEEIFGMKFDVIIGNPPYQLNTTEIEGKANAIPLYHRFVTQAEKMSPLLLSMIIPSRWMAGGSSILNDFRQNMIHSKNILELHDYISSKDCFPGVDIKGGVCYFLKNRNYVGLCDVYNHVDNNNVHHAKRYLARDNDDVYIRNIILAGIKDKTLSTNNVDSITSPQTPYGLLSNAFKSNSKDRIAELSDIRKNEDDIRVLGNGDGQKRCYKYLPKSYKLAENDGLYKYKIFISEAYGCGAIGEVPSTPVLGTPGDACTQTFIQIGKFDARNEAENFYSYLKTKFFRALVGILKQTQHANRGVYRYVPMQDFSKSWTDAELYEKYKLTQEEIDFIETNIKEMNIDFEEAE